MQRHAIRRAPGLLAASFLFVGAAVAWQSAHAQDAAGVRAVPTYESVGLYWSNPGSGASSGCDVKFRKQGDASWRQGLTMWYDSSSNECRGSLVYLTPGTAYEAQMSAGGASQSLTFTTWSNQYRVARTVTVSPQSGAYDISQGGSAGGYVVYDGTGVTLDAQNNAPYNITINASYVVVRGFTLKGAQQHGILINPNVHDVIIEDNDISGWGRTRDGQWGTDMDSGIRAICKNEELERVTIQRNKIHDPRYSANSWSVGHPAGPQGITFSYCGGQNVYRWNEIYSTNGNKYNDPIGGEDNFSTTGFPNKDSDIYGNVFADSWDDGIEADGGNRNVRIWGNYIDDTGGSAISTTLNSVGPIYIFRNVWNHDKFYADRPSDRDDRGVFSKSGSSSDFGNGRRYLFHNTMLQAVDPSASLPLGGGGGIGGTGDSQLVHNTISMNNIWHLWKANSAVYQVGSDNVFQNDMFNGRFDAPIVGGINAAPAYAPGNGWTSERGGMYQLAAGTPGYDAGVRIPNFNDDFQGAAPDVGAAEAGAAPMKFGVAAASATAGGTTTPNTPAGGSGTNTGSGTGTNTGAGTGTGSNTGVGSGGNSSPTTTPGSASASATMDSSAYAIAAGSAVTFTARIQGNAAVPTGTVAFTSDGTTIAGCGSVALSSGSAMCITSALSSGQHRITGAYSGDATYGTAQAGPITQTVTGTAAASSALPTKFGMDSTNYSVSAGDSVTFIASIPGAGGTVKFTDNGASIPGCSAAPVSSSGVATCNTNSLAAGSHAIVGNYSGNGSYSAGLAGPITQTVNGKTSTTVTGAILNVQGLWWGGASESGWGVNLSQQGAIVFATWFTYDGQGNGQWLVMSDGRKTGDNAYAGTLYRTRGPAFNAATFDSSAVTVTAVGTASFVFSDGNHGTFTATVDGSTVVKQITRQAFDARLPICEEGGSPAASANYQDLWWRTSGAESGWGLNLAHQGDTLFLTWFTYGVDGKPTWFVASDVSRNADGTFSGALYRTSGPAFNSATWDASRVSATPVGTVTLSFSDGNTGLFSFTVDGVSGSKPITRQLFSTPATVCRPS